MNEFLADLSRFFGRPVGFAEGVRMASDRARREIVDDIREGTVPPSVRSFSELHDYVDANAYGGAFDWPGPLVSDQNERYSNHFCRFWGAVQNNVNAWLAAGR